MARPALGTLVEIRIDHPDSTVARSALEEGFREVYRIQGLMSAYDERSEVFGLNRKGFCENARPETLEVVKKGLYYSELTEGAFNIAILPVLHLWEETACYGVSPGDSEVVKAMELTNWRDISIKENNIRLRKDGMSLTLGGVAKGYAIDRAVDAIRRLGIKRAMVNGGGDIRVVGGNGNGAWRVGVRSPNKERKLITVVELADQAIATSGTDRRPLDDIIEPESGTPAKRVKSSTVVAEHAVDAR
jgi:thiamine biosynthesis lipoprotein